MGKQGEARACLWSVSPGTPVLNVYTAFQDIDDAVVMFGRAVRHFGEQAGLSQSCRRC